MKDDPVINRTVPQGVPSPTINERQLDDDMLRLQRAMSASHRRGQRIEALRASVSVALALAGITVTLVGHGRTAVSILGAVWLVISAIPLRTTAESTARQGALLQEMFDTALFHIQWRSTAVGDCVPEPDVSRLARKLKSGSVRDKRIGNGWYKRTDGVHYPLDVLITQEQNLAWDARLRRRYARWVLAVAVIWSLLGLLAGMIFADATVTEILLSFFIPSSAAYQLSFDIWRGQRRIATERERLNKILTDELRRAIPGPINNTERSRIHDVARDIQDGIFRTRCDVSRVPEWYYRLHRNDDECDFADTAEGHRMRLAGRTN